MEQQSQIRTVIWPLKDIISGISIVVGFFVFARVLITLDFFRYRPWIADKFTFILCILSYVIGCLYAVSICKKCGFWPLFNKTSFSIIRYEFLLSLLFIVILNITLGLLKELLGVILKTKIDVPEVMKSWMFAPNSLILLITLITAFTFVPIAEEIFFRGFLYNAIKSRTTVLTAIILHAIAFAGVHDYDWANRFLIFVLGIALAIVYEKRHSLLSPIFVHGIINARITVPLIVLTLQNYHAPAINWEDAQRNPSWFKSFPPGEVVRQKDGMQQRQYAINTWGSKGSRQWKHEVNALHAVCLWFPNEREVCAKAKLGIVSIYLRQLKDYRRAVIAADDILSQYADQTEQCAWSLSEIGFAYLMLQDFKNSRIAFERIVNDFKGYKVPAESAHQGIRWLDVLENKG